MANDGGDENLKKELDILQSLIDVSATTLVGLRTQCANSAELTRQEIRTLEGKLIKLFSQQLVIKSKLKNGLGIGTPYLKQWLHVVRVEDNSVAAISQKISSLEELQSKSEHDLRAILTEINVSPEEFYRLFRALHNLRKYTDILKRGDQLSVDTQDANLSWGSFDKNYLKMKHSLSPRTTRSRASRASVPSEENLFNNNNNQKTSISATITASPSVSSINSLNTFNVVGHPPLTPPGYSNNVFSPPRERRKEKKFPTTPPARRRQLVSSSMNLLADTFPLTKSKSHESQLADTKSKNLGEFGFINESMISIRRGRLSTEPGPQTAGFPSPVKSPPYDDYSIGDDNDDISGYSSLLLPVPKSPQTPPIKVSMTHQIAHRFVKKFKLNAICGLCGLRIFGKALKCSDCKYSCHKECQEKVPLSCGLPHGYLTAFIANYKGSPGQENDEVIYSPSMGHLRKSSNNSMNSLSRIGHRKGSHPSGTFSSSQFTLHDSSSNTSSCNSSTPSSPAIQNNSTTPYGSQKQFHFPDILHSEPISELTLDTHSLLSTVNSPLDNNFINNQCPQENEMTISLSFNGTTKTTTTTTTTTNDYYSFKAPTRFDSQDSQVSDTDTIITDAQMARQNSLSLKEWDIPYDELTFLKKVGTGRFGTVYKGYWHGDVAIKNLNVKHNEKSLEQFKIEVGIFRKTRHENIILFMGACMKPPKLAIVTSYNKGSTLFSLIHKRKDKFNINKSTTMAQQICQGMGYLHAKGIVHRDLKTKNLFLDNGKVVITDFGLYSVTKLCFGPKTESLCIPRGWLCYLAPEIMRTLDAHKFQENELLFDFTTDVYAFGTVWYELLCGEWPFESLPPEAVIWQVGKGIKQPLANLQASVEVKDILMLCWQFKSNKRPDFQRLSDILGKLPKKRLERSPSHPVHMSRSAESVF